MAVMRSLQTLLLWIHLVTGCAATPEGSAEPGAFPPPVSSAVDASLPVTWRIQAREGSLAIRYRVENHGPAAVWLLDTAYVPSEEGYKLEPDSITTVPGDEPGLARFVRGHLRPPEGQSVAVEYAPAARELRPGAAAEGFARPALPLQSWHPYLALPPLPGDLTRAVLEIGLLDAPPEGAEPWERRHRLLPGGAPLRTPALAWLVQHQRFIRGEILDLQE